jgi:hypothetical protein
MVGFGLVGLVEQATVLLRENHFAKRRRNSRGQENQQRQENGGEEIQTRKLLSNLRLQGKPENIRMMPNKNVTIQV